LQVIWQRILHIVLFLIGLHGNMIAAAADDNPEAMDAAVKGLQGWIACFNKAKLSGFIRGVGVTDIGDIQHDEKLLIEVYKMGKAI